MSDYAKVRKLLEQHKKGLLTVNEAIGEISAMLGIPLEPGTFDNPFEVGLWVQWVGRPADVSNLDGPCQNGLSGPCVGKVTSLADRTTWVRWERTCAIHREGLNEQEPAATDCLTQVVNPYILGNLFNWPGKPKADTTPQKALNDPKVDCCGRDVADCDCPDNRCKSVYEGVRCTSDESHNPTEPAHVGSKGEVWYDSDIEDNPVKSGIRPEDDYADYMD